MLTFKGTFKTPEEKSEPEETGFLNRGDKKGFLMRAGEPADPRALHQTCWGGCTSSHLHARIWQAKREEAPTVPTIC